MKKVLFVCVENSCRSQMAEGFARLFGKGIFEPYSAGSKPSGKVDPVAVEVMKEAGIDILSQKSKGFNDLSVKEFDMVITLGCGDVCPFIPAKEHIEWKIDDPKGKEIGIFRIVRDYIKDHIKKLAEYIIRNEKGK
jgi:arsenate reductase